MVESRPEGLGVNEFPAGKMSDKTYIGGISKERAEISAGGGERGFGSRR